MSTYSQSLNNESRLTKLITPQRAALAGILAPILWTLLLAFLDIVQYPFLRSIGADPLTTSPASENGAGPYGLLYSASDFIFGVLVIVWALGLFQTIQPSWWARLGLVCLLVFGIGWIFGSATCDCMPGQPASLSGAIHNTASTVFLIDTIPMTIFCGLAFRQDPRWRSYAWYAIATGVLALPLFLLASSLPVVFSWFYIWLLLIPFGFIEVLALHLRELAP